MKARERGHSIPVLEASQPPDRSSVTIGGLTPAMVTALKRHLDAGNSWQSVLSTRVVGGAMIGDDLPAVGGRHRLLHDALEFVPYWPFAAGTPYRCRFDPPRDPAFADCPRLSLDIHQPVVTSPPPRVLAVHPSGGEAPENVLRFYVTFSEAMQRGHSHTHVCLTGPDGSTQPDVLYRAPVELWTHDMRCLTVLLDPGRLKRQVGPNRQLGPPLKPGRSYALVIGTGMIDQTGQSLAETHRHQFRVTAAVRQAINVTDWFLQTPVAGSTQPLLLEFPRPLDWAMLTRSIRIDLAGGPSLAGRVDISRAERRWMFTPVTPWAPGRYRIVVEPDLEDVCGNDLMAPFDRDLRRDETPLPKRPTHIPFRVT